MYRERRPAEHSWHQPRPEASLRLIRRAGLPAGARVIDVGGGDATLVDHLLDLGYRPGVLDVSGEALDRTRARLGDRAAEVEWYRKDVTTFRSPHRWDLWHDRATLHFLTLEEERLAYREALMRAVRPGGHVVLATFGPEGPTRCSGLPVRRYSAGDVAALFGPALELVESGSEEHVTPAGDRQRFLLCRLRREE